MKKGLIKSFEKRASKKRKTKELLWTFIGGNNKHRLGMNSGLCSYTEKHNDGTIIQKNILFDVGMLVGDPRKPEDARLKNFDTIIPDLSDYLKNKNDPNHIPSKKIDSIFLTHNHSDHIGALPFLALEGYELPRIYATPYTAKRLQQEFSNMGLQPDEWPEIFTIAPGRPIDQGPVKVSPFWVSHSTPQSVGFFIQTPEGNILTTGDFKMDQSVIWGPAFNTEHFKRIVSDPVDLMLIDSTGADRDIVPVTEQDVRNTLRGLMDKNPDKRFVVAVMSGFEENMASVAKVASEKGRKLFVSGWSHEQALSALQQTGLTLSESIGAPVDVDILTSVKAIRSLKETPSGQSVIVLTGAQGRSAAAMTRAAEGNHPAVHLDPKKDIILFCAPAIPGQERYRQRVIGMLRRKKFTVLTKKELPLYSQAHARLGELRDMVHLVNPKTVSPCHGDDHLRQSCVKAMGEEGYKTISVANGMTIRVTKRGCFEHPTPNSGQVPVIAFKTLQGTSWADRHYLATNVVIGDGAEDIVKRKQAANKNKKKRPRIFRIDPGLL